MEMKYFEKFLNEKFDNINSLNEREFNEIHKKLNIFCKKIDNFETRVRCLEDQDLSNHSIKKFIIKTTSILIGTVSVIITLITKIL